MVEGRTLAGLADDLAAGKVTSASLVEDCLARIAAPEGEGAKAFISVSTEKASAAAAAMDGLRRVGAAPSRFAGIPISIKDLFDVAGERTSAASKVLADQAVATSDAPVIARLRRAGFVFIGRANMSEFAYSGMGLNPHFGTPRGPWDRVNGRIPGGSSSGGAVSVADGMAHATLGSDTGGSCRIPAAFNGITGYKPTQSRIPTAGATPLSTTLDSIGPLARSVQCCATLDAIIAGDDPQTVRPAAPKAARLVIPKGSYLEDMDAEVARAFEKAISLLSGAGFSIAEREIKSFDRIPALNSKGGFAAAESYAWHRPFVNQREQHYDPRVFARIMRGKEQTAADYIDLLAGRAALIDGVKSELEDFDGFILPTVPILPPKMSEVETREGFNRANILTLRNTSIANMIDGCSISLPINAPGEPPIGLMISAIGGRDRAVFSIAAAVEQTLQGSVSSL